jgi:hypothetical protein
MRTRSSSKQINTEIVVGADALLSLRTPPSTRSQSVSGIMTRSKTRMLPKDLHPCSLNRFLEEEVDSFSDSSTLSSDDSSVVRQTRSMTRRNTESHFCTHKTPTHSGRRFPNGSDKSNSPEGNALEKCEGVKKSKR